jgi:hypothetical protein
MNREQLVIGIGACLFGAMAVTFVTKAGDLSPPVGAIQSTMSNLQDIQTSLDNIGAAVNVPTPTWEYIYVTGTSASAISGSGILHTVVVAQGLPLLYDFDTGPVLVNPMFKVPVGTAELDVRYENGITVNHDEGGSFSALLIYRPDPAP